MDRRKSIRRGFSLLPSTSEAVGRKTRKGFNLIESAIVLAVVGLVVAGIWVAASSLAQRRFEQQFMEGLVVLHNNVQEYFSQQISCSYFALSSSDPQLTEIIYPKQWSLIDVDKNLHGPTVYLPCPTGSNPKKLQLTFWQSGGFPDYLCSSLSPRIDALGDRLGITQFWGDGAYTTCRQDRDWSILIPITRNTF